MRPASIRIYLSPTPTSMQFMPISPSPPMGNTRKGGPSSGGGPGNGLQKGGHHLQANVIRCNEHMHSSPSDSLCTAR